eukprot:c34183_g1_i1 orf=2-2446(-)
MDLDKHRIPVRETYISCNGWLKLSNGTGELLESNGYNERHEEAQKIPSSRQPVSSGINIDHLRAGDEIHITDKFERDSPEGRVANQSQGIAPLSVPNAIVKSVETSCGQQRRRVCLTDLTLELNTIRSLQSLESRNEFELNNDLNLFGETVSAPHLKSENRLLQGKCDPIEVFGAARQAKSGFFESPPCKIHKSDKYGDFNFSASTTDPQSLKLGMSTWENTHGNGIASLSWTLHPSMPESPHNSRPNSIIGEDFQNSSCQRIDDPKRRSLFTSNPSEYSSNLQPAQAIDAQQTSLATLKLGSERNTATDPLLDESMSVPIKLQAVGTRESVSQRAESQNKEIIRTQQIVGLGADTEPPDGPKILGTRGEPEIGTEDVERRWNSTPSLKLAIAGSVELFSTADSRPRNILCAQERKIEKVSSSTVNKKRKSNGGESDHGMQLVSLLLKCASAIAKDEKQVAAAILGEINKRADMYGDSMQRLAAYIAQGITARLVIKDSPTYKALMGQASSEVLYFRAFAALHRVSPCFQFAHFTANQAILEAFEGRETVHVIDINMSQGLQWPSLLQSLASRPGGPPSVLRMTGVGKDPNVLQETGSRLENFARNINLNLEFEAVIENRLDNLNFQRLHPNPSEAMAINCVFELHQLLTDPSDGKITKFMNAVREAEPTVVTIVEQEANHNAPTFLRRFMESLHYYAAIFDSMEASFPQQSEERVTIEQVLFAQQIRNIIACEDEERVERHETWEAWKRRMEMAGFLQLPFSQHAVRQAKLLLHICECDGYCLHEREGMLSLGWQQRHLITASAWSTHIPPHH